MTESSLSSSPCIEKEEPVKRKRATKRPKDEAIALLRESFNLQKAEAAEKKVVDNQMLKLQEELIDIEKQKIELLKKLLM